MSWITDKFFWIRTSERAVKTFAQSLALVFLGDQAYNVISVNWPQALGLAATGALLSVLTSIGSTTVGDSNSPSLVENVVEEQIAEKVESGEPVGDPERVVEPESPALQAVKAVRKRTPRKKVGE